ncbi:MAG: PQQ-like beta-propeller repeat protein [Candidatus Aminicenantes bacterium]|nr:PQQ-like beta-propeller repeat protein [Candidatus Aminicenantes bacterium]
MKNIFSVILFIISVSVLPVTGQVDSQWRGPNRDGVYPDEKLLDRWPAAGPQSLWTVFGLGEGYSSAAVTADRVYVTGMIAGKGYLFAFDIKGRPLWKAEYGAEWDGSHPGARTTPTVVGSRLYLLSTAGLAVCFDADGKKKWSIDLIRDFGAKNLEWGLTESPLVDGDRVFFTPGGTNAMMTALDRHSGKILWKIQGNGEKSSYCSPRIVKHGNMRLLLTMTAKSVVGIDADSGAYLWSYPHITSYDVNANTPLYHDGNVFIVSGYGAGGQMFRLARDGKKMDSLWSQSTLDSQMGAVVLVNGYIYGSGQRKRAWHCLDWKTGAVQYSAKEIGNKGNIIFSDGMMYCYSEEGDVALVKPNPKKFEVVSSFKIDKGAGPHWAHLAIKNGRLYVRHGEALMVYNIAR